MSLLSLFKLEEWILRDIELCVKESKRRQVLKNVANNTPFIATRMTLM